MAAHQVDGDLVHAVGNALEPLRASFAALEALPWTELAELCDQVRDALDTTSFYFSRDTKCTPRPLVFFLETTWTCCLFLLRDFVFVFWDGGGGSAPASLSLSLSL